MSLIKIRKRSLIIETQFHEGGPVAEVPLKLAAACAVIENPFAGRYERRERRYQPDRKRW